MSSKFTNELAIMLMNGSYSFHERNSIYEKTTTTSRCLVVKCTIDMPYYDDIISDAESFFPCSDSSTIQYTRYHILPEQGLELSFYCPLPFKYAERFHKQRRDEFMKEYYLYLVTQTIKDGLPFEQQQALLDKFSDPRYPRAIK